MTKTSFETFLHSQFSVISKLQHCDATLFWYDLLFFFLSIYQYVWLEYTREIPKFLESKQLCFMNTKNFFESQLWMCISLDYDYTQMFYDDYV